MENGNIGLRQMYEILKGKECNLRVEMEKFESHYKHKYRPYEGIKTLLADR